VVQPEVSLTGFPQHGWLTNAPASVIVRQADWHAVAQVLGIQNPPRIDFRTHFLFFVVGDDVDGARFEIDGRGDLRAILVNPEVDGIGLRPGPVYLVKSFRRTEVKTVNGLPLPR
jgi:hypothetical protein